MGPGRAATHNMFRFALGLVALAAVAQAQECPRPQSCYVCGDKDAFGKDGRKLTSLTVQYRPDAPAGLTCDQNDKGGYDGSVMGPLRSLVAASRKDSKDGPYSTRELGDGLYQIATVGKMPAETFIVLTDTSGRRQEVDIHTSCSQQLCVPAAPLCHCAEPLHPAHTPAQVRGLHFRQPGGGGLCAHRRRHGGPAVLARAAHARPGLLR